MKRGKLLGTVLLVVVAVATLVWLEQQHEAQTALLIGEREAALKEQARAQKALAEHLKAAQKAHQIKDEEHAQQIYQLQQQQQAALEARRAKTPPSPPAAKAESPEVANRREFIRSVCGCNCCFILGGFLHGGMSQNNT